MSTTTTDPTALTEEFHYQNRYIVKWTRLGPSTAPPVVLIHGTPWSSRLWAPYALALSSTYSVYLLDNPGYGETVSINDGAEAQASDSSLAGQAAVFAAIFAHWGLHEDGRAPHVVAHDNGGLVSLRAALVHGCVYRSLMLVDVVAAGPFGAPLFRLVAGNQGVFDRLPPAVFEGVVRAYVRDAAFKQLRPEEEEMLIRPWLREGGQEGFFRQMVQADGRDASDVEGRYKELGEKGLPVKIVWGKDDKWISVDRAEKLKGMIGGKTELVVVEDAGHLIHLDQPVRLMGEMALFLAKVDRLI